VVVFIAAWPVCGAGAHVGPARLAGTIHDIGGTRIFSPVTVLGLCDAIGR
jgi:hypothetical protein